MGFSITSTPIFVFRTVQVLKIYSNKYVGGSRTNVAKAV